MLTIFFFLKYFFKEVKLKKKSLGTPLIVIHKRFFTFLLLDLKKR